MTDFLLAYGGFSGDVSKDMSKIYAFIFPKLIFLSIELYLIYVIGKKSSYQSILVILIHLVLVALYLPMLGVMGEYGPHHMGSELSAKIITIYTCFILALPFLIFIQKKLSKAEKI